jgi:multicomponent Na+:H+ antiporter subunit E
MLFASLAIVLLGYWLVLSGHYTALTLTAGVLSALAVTGFSSRMGVLDREGHPIHLMTGALTYWPWLALEIVKSAWDVTKITLSPTLRISPTMVRVKAGQKTSVGLATYANSITLTPGTISARVTGNTILVHALTQQGAESLAEGTMNRRVARFEGRR